MHPSLILPCRVAYASLDALMAAFRHDETLYRAAWGLLCVLEERLQVTERKYKNRERRAS